MRIICFRVGLTSLHQHGSNHITFLDRYRLCVHAHVMSDFIEVEMELRKSSTYGKVNPKTGHVPSLEDVEIHSEIRNLFDKEDDAEVLAEEESIKDEDFKTTHEQLRVLERVYHDIIDKQLEERRKWGWRTVHNKHLYSHMVMGKCSVSVFAWLRPRQQ